jgi:hypothetical protein
MTTWQLVERKKIGLAGIRSSDPMCIVAVSYYRVNMPYDESSLI